MADTSEGETVAQTPPGPGVDASGQAVVDPTLNVKEHVALQVVRLDDLREAAEARAREVAQLRENHASQVLDLRARLGEKGEECVNELAALRASHAAELRKAETERLDAIRRVDVEAVQRAAEVQATQAGALATQVTTSAETLRASVAAAATAAQISLTAALEPLQKAIDDLRRSQYQEQGQKTNVVETQARGANLGLWVGAGLAALAVFVSMLAAVAAIAVAALT